LESLLGYGIERVHIVGGCSRNALLNQFAANALQVPVETGPTEATAIGNCVVQAIAMGDLPSLTAAREVIRASFPTETVLPAEPELWREQSRRFGKLKRSGGDFGGGERKFDCHDPSPFPLPGGEGLRQGLG
jgi:rhamnulokinase